MRRPNFFIVGAPKCGTTALSEYLRAHPGVYFSADKEPNFFNTDCSERIRLALTEDEYLTRCFSGADEGHVAIGEGSVLYLQSSVALAGIRRFEPDARIIIMVRNPIEMAYSMHAQHVASLLDDEPDFRTAWELQEARKAGDHIPSTCAEPSVLQYREMCLLGVQVKRALAVFPRDQVLIIAFDDFVADTRPEYERVLRFLGLSDDGRADFPAYGEGRQLRSRVLLAAVSAVGSALGPVYRGAKDLLGVRRTGLQSTIGSLLTRPGRRAPLDAQFRRQLADGFREDVALLQTVMGRDLSHWCLDQSGIGPGGS